ncbi:thioredoxin domain-containing protein [Niallia taxi]|uniref:thioredoxin domain-containing protein n=1 Tax=Niallia taxi TaxID=2499688 RepID=UPI003D27BCFF
MKTNYKIIGSIVAIILLTTGVITYCKHSENQMGINGNANKVQSLTKKINKINDNSTMLYQGNKKASNEILFVYDYSCPWCKEWEAKIYPSVVKWIDQGKVKYRNQSMVYLDDTSLLLSNFDQNLKRYYPEQYFSINQKIMLDGYKEAENWGSIDYIKYIIKEYNLDSSKVLSKPKQDAISITREYTKSLSIEGVPSLFINGKQISNPFDLEEIKNNLD